MGLWRCYNPECAEPDAAVPGFDFEEKLPVCPRCGLTKDDGIVVPLVTIHYTAPHPRVPGRCTGVWACDSNRRNSGTMVTTEPEVVNCSACRKTEAWKSAYLRVTGDMPPGSERDAEIKRLQEMAYQNAVRRAQGTVRVTDAGCCG